MVLGVLKSRYVWADTAKFTDVIVARLRKIWSEKVRCSSKIKPRLRAEWVVVREQSCILDSRCLSPIRRNSVLEELRVRTWEDWQSSKNWSVVEHFVSDWCWSGNLMDRRRGSRVWVSGVASFQKKIPTGSVLRIQKWSYDPRGV